ncbi:hypothetical protein EDD16DRAFT_1620105 [Pisolithus croceorrhizus]|nr:hypothetical protein EDD16DRAFT_1620105 [Pisolithus croceorrhizus]
MRFTVLYLYLAPFVTAVLATGAGPNFNARRDSVQTSGDDQCLQTHNRCSPLYGSPCCSGECSITGILPIGRCAVSFTD